VSASSPPVDDEPGAPPLAVAPLPDLPQQPAAATNGGGPDAPVPGDVHPAATTLPPEPAGPIVQPAAPPPPVSGFWATGWATAAGDAVVPPPRPEYDPAVGPDATGPEPDAAARPDVHGAAGPVTDGVAGREPANRSEVDGGVPSGSDGAIDSGTGAPVHQEADAEDRSEVDVPPRSTPDGAPPWGAGVVSGTGAPVHQEADAEDRSEVDVPPRSTPDGAPPWGAGAVRPQSEGTAGPEAGGAAPWVAGVFGPQGDGTAGPEADGAARPEPGDAVPPQPHAPEPAPGGVPTDARDRLLAVLLDDPQCAVGAVEELETCLRELERLSDAVRQERAVLRDVLRRLTVAGLSPEQLARLARMPVAEVEQMLAGPPVQQP